VRLSRSTPGATDPPYHLTSIVKRFGADGAAPAKSGKTGAYARASAGFMGKKWDGGDVAFRPETWRAVFDNLKPGAHLVAFSGTRTFHRMVCAIEDAGFEIRDTIAWAYGSGIPEVARCREGDRCARDDRRIGTEEPAPRADAGRL
jgi:site-specific DNA-methyltransferase (adenine-specific)